MKGNRSYASLVYLFALTISPLLTIAQVGPPIGGKLDSLVGPELVDKTVEQFPLLSPREEKEGKSGKFWQFLLKEEDRRRDILPKTKLLKPNALILRQTKQPAIQQHFALGNDSATLTRFETHTTPDFGQSLGSYLSYPSLQGAVFSGEISDLASTPITFSSVYLKGQRGLTPLSEFGLNYDYAWSLKTDAKLLSEQIDLHGEYAWTHYNYDPFIATSAQNDNAYKLQLSYQPLQAASFFESPLNGVMGVKHKRVGLFFQSPVEATSEQGISRWEGFTHLDWRGLAWDNSIIQEAGNGERFLSPQRTYTTQLQGSYRFQRFKLPLWLGSPNLNMALSRNKIEQQRRQLSKAEFKADFSYQNWHWNLSHSLNWNKIETMPTEAQYFATSAAEAGLKLFSNGNLSLDPMLRYQYRGANLDELLVGIKSHTVFVPELLKGQFQIAAKQNWDNKQSKRTYTTSGNLNWRFAHQKPLLPAIHLFLEGRYQIDLNQVDFNEDYRVFLGLSFD
ncbi:hypothetical protein [Nitrosococcus watsonii]|uniref:Uncharacterized protein n=1 Tax=Nitrosococcus watsoni (strain C-113) TaxID=105559 RepID=D8K6R8_NITWC|nr:hypothetical protein [Nitrosococcus watsonii]ADJ28595.1 conserved hypothetical protein [Nitrosococcus watsonii C-113]